MTANTPQKTFTNCWYTLLLIFLTSVLLHPKPGVSQGGTAELALINGKILTMDNDESIVSAVKIVDGRIVAIGGSLEDIDPSTTLVGVEIFFIVGEIHRPIRLEHSQINSFLVSMTQSGLTQA